MRKKSKASEEPPSDEELATISEYVTEMMDCGIDTMDLHDIEKRFPISGDCAKVLTKLGCLVIDDLVLLNKPNYQ